MATLAAYPGWYRDDVLLRQDITEAAIVRSYTPTDEDLGSWDASAEKNGSVMAYVSGTKLTLVCDSLTEIPAQMFFKFLSLEKVSGLSKVEVIGERAFCYTPKISSIDIDPAKLTYIGDNAFRMSSAEDAVDLSSVPFSVVGDMATRHKRWGDKLEAIQGIKPARSVYFDVPYSEQQTKYDDIPYGTKDGKEYTVAEGGCNGLSCYHIWNALYAGSRKEYKSFREWFDKTLNINKDWAKKYDYTLAMLADALGWTLPKQYVVYANDGVTALNAILDKLMYGVPVMIQMWSVNELGSQHNVCVVGCDAETRKLAVMDSSVVGTAGVLSWLAFEDIFNDGGDTDTDRVYIIDFNVPVLDARNGWYKSSTAKSTITEIEIVREVPSDFHDDENWKASSDGKVMAYRDGTKLTIAGNGCRFIWCNSDSSYLFSGATTSDFFNNVTRIKGAELLNTRDVVSITGILSGCKALTFIKYEDWDMANCEAMNSAFQFLCSYEKLDFSKWTAPKVKTLRMAFQGNVKIGTPALVSIKGLGGIGTNGITNISAMCNGCSNLQEIDIANLHVSIAAGETGQEQNTFNGCSNLKHLDFSNWNNKNAGNSTDMLTGTNLEKITIGKNFRFNGFSLPASDESKIPLADGNWYDIDGTAYTSDRVAAANVARTYYASKFVIEGEDKTRVFVTAGLLKQMAMAARAKSGKEDLLKPADALRLLALETDT